MIDVSLWTFVRFAIATSIPTLALVGSARSQCDQQELKAGDGAVAQEFGWATAIEGDRAIVGAFADGADGVSGSAYVWRRTASGWQLDAKLVASSAQPFTGFGQAVDIDGEFALVGARYLDHSGIDSGGAFVFRRASGTWLPDALLTAPDGATDDEFGQSVAIRGDVAVVGAAGDDDAGQSSGSAWVFRRVAGIWVAEARLSSFDGRGGDGFGASVDVDDGVIVVGAAGADGITSNAGCAYVFEAGESGWTETAKLSAADGANFDAFGFDVALRGDVIGVGAFADGGSGSAYVFRRDGGAWLQEARLAPGDPASGQNFGFSIAVSAAGVLVGAFGDDHSGNQSGAAYWFESEGDRWSEVQKLTDPTPQSAEYFGFSVALSGARLLVGCPDDHEPSFAFGSASFVAMDSASWWSFGSGWPGTSGVPAFTASAAPVLGSSLTLELDNSAGNVAPGVVLFGLQSASLATGLGGTLLVDPLLVLPVTVPSPSLQLPVPIPSLPALCGVTVLAQALQADPGASRGVAFSPGLALLLGGG